jgi:hypothetical protein
VHHEAEGGGARGGSAYVAASLKGGSPAEWYRAEYLYREVLREFPGDPAAAAALYGFGRLQADPAGGLRNYRAAYLVFSRLVTEYPGSRWAIEARVWQATLSDLLAREDETARTNLQLRWREGKRPDSGCRSSSSGAST